jgi:hypothetical protein
MRRYRIVALLAVLAALCAVGPISSASAWTGIVRGVVNADGGVFWRGNPPDWNNPIRNVGYGVYNGDQIELDCWTNGSTVPPYNNNTLWYHARVVAGLGKGDGFVNDHFIATGINLPNIVVPGVPQCGGSPAPAPPPPPVPTPPSPSPSPTPSPPPGSGGGSVYSIFNADGGVFFRDSPSWGDTRQVVGQGVYNGDQVRLLCGAMGEAVGPYANKWWSYVENLSRPGAGKGWVNAHFINDAMPANSPSPGEGTCDGNLGAGGTGPGPGGTIPVSTGTQSVFYSPDNDIPEEHSAGDKSIRVDDWSNAHLSGPDKCATGRASSPSLVPSTVTTLAGWSYGRLGPAYFLISATAEQRARIHAIILFDPGSASNMEGACDETLHPRVAVALATWLQANSANHLLILTGHDTENRLPIISRISIGGTRLGHAGFNGLWHFYLPAIWRQPFADRALVCDYDNLSHEKVIEDFRWTVRFPPSGCPIANDAPMPVAWHP